MGAQTFYDTGILLTPHCIVIVCPLLGIISSWGIITRRQQGGSVLGGAPVHSQVTLLRNHLLQCGHCTDPDCWETGSIRSLVHLCLALSASLLKHLLHTLHSTDSVSCCCLLVCSSLYWYSATHLLYISCYIFLVCTASNQQPAPTSSAVKFPLTTSLHRPFGPQSGRVFDRHAKRAVLGVHSSGILTRCPSHCNRHLITLEVTVSSSPISP